MFGQFLYELVQVPSARLDHSTLVPGTSTSTSTWYPTCSCVTLAFAENCRQYKIIKKYIYTIKTKFLLHESCLTVYNFPHAPVIVPGTVPGTPATTLLPKVPNTTAVQVVPGTSTVFRYESRL